MIFLSVGTQLPFERLVREVDIFCGENSYQCFAQIANGNFRPANIEFVDFLSPSEYQEQISKAKVLVSHAGMGSIITALSYGKPLIIMPRLSEFAEHRNDHQVDTCNSFKDKKGIFVVNNQKELRDALVACLSGVSVEAFSRFADDDFISEIKNLIY
ncbi:hypothetical protein KUV89_09300 [Marinobacter hydrocarbonoclasticus]|nr:hypothetical protein [Marinobacter nauticus]